MSSKPSSMMERMSAHKMRASTQRRESTGVGKTDDAGNNGEMFPMPSMETLVTGFSLDAEKIATMGSITAEKKVELKNLTEKIATSTGAMLASMFNTIATTETFGEIDVVVEGDKMQTFLDEAERLEAAAAEARAAATEAMTQAEAAVDAAKSDAEKEAAEQAITEAEALTSAANEAEEKAETEGSSLTITTGLGEAYMQTIRDALVVGSKDAIMQHIEDSIVIAADDVVLPSAQLSMMDSLERSLIDAPVTEKQHPKRIEAMDVYNTCITKLKNLVTTLSATKDQLGVQMDALKTATEKMNTGSVVTDAQLEAVKKASVSTKAMKEIIEGQKIEIYELISETYAGIASWDSHSRQKSLSLFELEMPDGLTDSPGDPLLGKKMLATIQQVCQTYITEFYEILPIVELLIANPDPSDPIEIAKICSACEVYGEALGAAYKIADGKMYELIHRTNPDMIRLAMTDLETGGNGDPTRKSVMEEGSAVSVIAFWLHHCEQDIENLKRHQTMVVDQSFSVFQSGSILKGVDVFMERYRVAESLGLKLTFRNTIFPSAMLISKRGGGLPELYELGMRYVNDEALKARCEEAGTCTAELGQFLGQVAKVAKKMGNDSPSQVDDPLAKNALVQMNALVAVHSNGRANSRTPDGQKPGGGDKSGGEWKCGHVNCKNGIVPNIVKKKHIERMAGKLNKPANSIPQPPHLLCTECQIVFNKGTDIKLSNGSNRTRFNNGGGANTARKPPNGGGRPAGKNAARNAARRARKSESAAKLKAYEAADAEKAEKPDAPSASKASDGISQAEIESYMKVGAALAIPVAGAGAGAETPAPAPAPAPAAAPVPATPRELLLARIAASK